MYEQAVCREVFAELGAGHTERVYHRGVISVLNHKGIPHRSEVTVPIYVRGDCVGNGRADIVVGDMAIELKALSNPPAKVSGQLSKYVKSLNKDVTDAFNRRAVRSPFFAGPGGDDCIAEGDFEQERAALCRRLFRGVAVNFNQRTERVDVTLLRTQESEPPAMDAAPQPKPAGSPDRMHRPDAGIQCQRWMDENVQRFVRLYGLRDKIVGHCPEPLSSLARDFEAFVGAEIQSLRAFQAALGRCAPPDHTAQRAAGGCDPDGPQRGGRLRMDTMDLT